MSVVAERPHALRLVREIGPFDEASLPRGLLSEHRLKPWTYGRLTMLEGSVTLVWDDGSQESEVLNSGDETLIAPERVHHLEMSGHFLLKIAFLTAEAG